ncbi:MAG TPA: enoyl-CoA hydratase/isomerase family protein [Anaerolineae bacterium]|nr:enoyl-CoA hydratase/isomerase family protein [Anaerolineae bacterium]
MNTYKNWLFEVEDRVATITLNRPKKRNAISPETLYELRTITQAISSRDDIWVVVLAATGDHFSVGVDVNTIGLMIGQDAESYRHNLRELQGCVDLFDALNKPTIAQIQGYCLGGGLLLALCCDFRIAAHDAIFGLPEVKRSIAVIMGTQRITKIAGIPATKEMVLLAENFGAQQAQAYNLLHRVVDSAELPTATAQFADKFRHLPPRAVHIANRIIDEGHTLSLRTSQELEIALQQPLLDSADFREAIASFFEKRPPIFTGE